MKYLIVEDNAGDVALLKLRLARLGCDVTVTHPQNALQKNQEDKPEVVQLDGLGGMCFELYEQMLQDNPEARFILYSADIGLQDKAREEGMRVFEKDYGSSALLRYIESFLKT